MKCSDHEKWLSELSRNAKRSDKSWMKTFILSLGLGFFGIDRFYLNSVWLGMLKLLTCGGLGLWYVLDIFILILGKMKDADGGIVNRS